MDYNKLDDDTLIRLVARSQSEALSVLYDRYSRLVYSVAMTIIDDPSVADEITQDAFVRLWENAAAFRPELGKLTTWLTGITRNRAIDVFRRRKIRPEGHAISWEDALPEEMSDGSNVEQEVELAHRQAKVRRAVAQLPDEQRSALALAYFRGYAHQQIADTLGEPLGTVKTRIRLAMQKLREILKSENEIIAG